MGVTPTTEVGYTLRPRKLRTESCGTRIKGASNDWFTARTPRYTKCKTTKINKYRTKLSYATPVQHNVWNNIVSICRLLFANLLDTDGSSEISSSGWWVLQRNFPRYFSKTLDLVAFEYFKEYKTLHKKNLQHLPL